MLRLAGRTPRLHTKHAAICGAVCAFACALIALNYGAARDAPARALELWPGAPMSSDGPPSPQIHNFHFKRFTLNDGLSQSTVNCIAQDRQGQIIVAGYEIIMLR